MAVRFETDGFDYGVMAHSRTEYERDYGDFLANIGKGKQEYGSNPF